MTFKYFDRPDLFTEVGQAQCDFCKENKICFDGTSFRGTFEFNSICPECLSLHKLKDLDTQSCEGDIKELKRQISELYPALSEPEVEQLAKERTEELEKTTPLLVTWQDWFWPCADGEYCQFIGFGSKQLYKKLAGGQDEGEFYFNSIYYNLQDTDLEYLWDEIMPEKEIKNFEESNYDTLFYVFKSIKSDKVVTVWDCN